MLFVQEMVVKFFPEAMLLSYIMLEEAEMDYMLIAKDDQDWTLFYLNEAYDAETGKALIDLWAMSVRPSTHGWRPRARAGRRFRLCSSGSASSRRKWRLARRTCSTGTTATITRWKRRGARTCGTGPSAWESRASRTPSSRCASS